MHVLGTPLLVTDYARLMADCQVWARANTPLALEFANTHIVAMRRHDPAFHDLTSEYDLFVPDGMPLVWCLNRAGANLTDRVYGPTFMREFLRTCPKQFSHYLIGGSEECGARLRDRFLQINPGLNFVGAFHGLCSPDGFLADKTGGSVIDEINELSPDFIWVGLGTPKQQAWVKHHKKSLKRGVVLSVGFAFDVNAQLKPDAPDWMQQRGLTWMFRLASEPRRLGPRYLRYNRLFLYYVLKDGLRRAAWGRIDTPQSL